jgi:hypothetical protein
MNNELLQLPRLELIQYMEEVLEDLWELSKQLDDESIKIKIRELSKDLSALRDAELDEHNLVFD